MSQSESKTKFILAVALAGGRFTLTEDATFEELNKAIEGAEHWKSKTAPGGDALVVDEKTMEIYWPERLKGKKIEEW